MDEVNESNGAVTESEPWPSPGAKGSSGFSGDPIVRVGLAIVVIGALVVGGLALGDVFNGSVTHISNPSLIAACNADAKTVETAVSAYNAQFTPAIGLEISGTAGGDITPGKPATYAYGTQAQLILNAGLVRNWPASNLGYAISLSSHVPGNVAVYIPATSTSPIDFENETSTTGCNSL